MRMQLPRPILLALAILAATLGLGNTARSQVTSDLNAQWSNASNPNGVWTYREGNNALPSVAAWQSTIGGWATAQPGWAESANGTDRLPFWFRSNGSETFARDWLDNDIVVHSTDTVNGIGNGPANVIWASPFNGLVSISGNTWLGRELGRSNRWNIYNGATLLSSGDTLTGDPFNRANPFNFSAGTGGAAALLNIPVTTGDTIRLEIVALIPSAGEFQGVNFTVTQVPEPGSLALIGIPAAAIWVGRRRKVCLGG